MVREANQQIRQSEKGGKICPYLNDIEKIFFVGVAIFAQKRRKNRNYQRERLIY